MKKNKDKISTMMARDAILGIAANARYAGGVEHYNRLGIAKLQKLVDEGHADLQDQQNLAPTLGAFKAFMEKHPRFTAHGYAVHYSREDYRVTIEGLELLGPATPEEESDFRKLADNADDFWVTPQKSYCWFD